MNGLFYYAWRTGDGITHVAWSENAEIFATRFTVCERTQPRMHSEGQSVYGAQITCVRCSIEPLLPWRTI